MSKRDPGILLGDICAAIDKIERYTNGLDEAGFLGDEKTIDAVIRNSEVIGEAVKQMPPDFKNRHAHIQWPQIAGLRNRIVHDYARIDLRLIWQILKTTLPDFRRRFAACCKRAKNER